MTLVFPVAVTKRSPTFAASAIGITSKPSIRASNARTCQEEICRAHYSLKRRLSSPVSAVEEKLGKSIIHRDDWKPQTPLLLHGPQPSDPGCSLFTGPYDSLRKPFSFLICGNRKFSTVIN